MFSHGRSSETTAYIRSARASTTVAYASSGAVYDEHGAIAPRMLSSV
jgi:hypothetical protein